MKSVQYEVVMTGSDSLVDREPQRLLRRIRILTVGFAIGLALSGITAFPLRWEVDLLARWLGAADVASPDQYSGLLAWIVRVREGLHHTYDLYPFMAYGTDWLAFAHLLLALVFYGVWRDPVRNIWILNFGLIACIATFPIIVICGALRGIPGGWQCIDACFGLAGLVPLWICRRYTLQLARFDSRWSTPPTYAL